MPSSVTAKSSASAISNAKTLEAVKADTLYHHTRVFLKAGLTSAGRASKDSEPVLNPEQRDSTKRPKSCVVQHLMQKLELAHDSRYQVYAARTSILAISISGDSLGPHEPLDSSLYLSTRYRILVCRTIGQLLLVAAQGAIVPYVIEADVHV
jgi:hypothetical protein